MNKILLGDSQEVLKTIGDDTVHLTCTSPPYYNARSYSIWPTYEEYLQFLTNVFEQVLRVTKPGRMCAVNLSPVIQARESRAHESKRLAIPFHFFSLMEKMGWSAQDLLCVGDAPNDLSMFEMAGWSVSVGTPFVDVRAAADVVSPYPNSATIAPLVDAILAVHSAQNL